MLEGLCREMNKHTRKCYQCQEPTELKEFQDTLTLKGREITYTVRCFSCPECGAMFDDKESLGNNLKSAHTAFAELPEALTMKEEGRG